MVKVYQEKSKRIIDPIIMKAFIKSKKIIDPIKMKALIKSPKNNRSNPIKIKAPRKHQNQIVLCTFAPRCVLCNLLCT